MRFDIVGVGNPIIDVLLTREGKREALGGNASNTLIHLKHFGLRAALIGSVGNDIEGKRIIKELKEESVFTLISKGKKTSKILIESTPKERKAEVVHYEHLEKLSEKSKKCIRDSASLFIPLSERLFEISASVAENSGSHVFASLHWAKPKEDKIQNLLKSKTSIIFANKDEYKLFSKILKEKKGSIIAVTLGKRGCMIIQNGKKKIYRGFKVKTIDPTGAGDAFAAGFIYGFLKKWPLDKAAEFANACGALATTQYGARSVVLTVEEVKKFIKSQKR